MLDSNEPAVEEPTVERGRLWNMLDNNEPEDEDPPFDIEKCVAEKSKENWWVNRYDDDFTWCRHFVQIKMCPLHDQGCTPNAWMNAQCQSCEPNAKQKCLNYLKWHWTKSGLHGLNEKEAQLALFAWVDTIQWGEWDETWEDREKDRLQSEKYEAKAKKGQHKKERGQKRRWQKSWGNSCGNNDGEDEDDDWWGSWKDEVVEVVDLEASDEPTASDAQAAADVQAVPDAQVASSWMRRRQLLMGWQEGTIAADAQAAISTADAKAAVQTTMQGIMPGAIQQAVELANVVLGNAGSGGPPPANAGSGGPPPANAGFGGAAAAAGSAAVDFETCTVDFDVPAAVDFSVASLTVSQARTLKYTFERAENAFGGAIVEMAQTCKALTAEQIAIRIAKDALEKICPH